MKRILDVGSEAMRRSRTPLGRLAALAVSLVAIGSSAQGSGPPSRGAELRGATEVAGVAYVDSLNAGFLFRGSRPLTGDASNPVRFNYKGLRKAISEAARAAGVSIPSKYTLIDVSLLWVDDLSKVDQQPQPQQAMLERKMAFREYSFFRSPPKLGQLHLWPSEGTEVNPKDPTLSQCRDDLAANLDDWMRDPLVDRVETIRSWLEDPAAIGVAGPMVIYVHCYSGCDRTGELVGAYSMRYLDRTWEEAADANGEACDRQSPPYFEENCNTLQWYALYLNLKFGKNLQWDTATPCPSAAR